MTNLHRVILLKRSILSMQRMFSYSRFKNRFPKYYFHFYVSNLGPIINQESQFSHIEICSITMNAFFLVVERIHQ